MSQQGLGFRPCVLVIDDDRAVCDVIVRLLERAGFQGIGAYGGIDGVNVAEEAAPDLILVDLQMEGVDGRITLRLLRAQVPATIIVAFTGLLIRDEPLLYEGFDAVIRKPVGVFELVQHIAGALEAGGRLCRHSVQPAELLSAASSRLPLPNVA